MHATLPLLKQTDFPAIRRHALDTLQVNLGYKCNQACFHCHVNASPDRKEMMGADTIELVLRVLRERRLSTLDVTGGAPELNPHFRHLVSTARALGTRVIDRCNLTILNEPGFEDLASYLASERVEVTASLPCYTKENVDRQRGSDVFESSILGLRKLNALGYGLEGTGLTLNLVYNPLGRSCRPRRRSSRRTTSASSAAISASRSITCSRWRTCRSRASARRSCRRASSRAYMALLRNAHNPANLDGVMCRTLVSVDWRGYLYDCDFNQMLGIPLYIAGKPKRHLADLFDQDLAGSPISVAEHCYGCTAGQGSSCGGALG